MHTMRFRTDGPKPFRKVASVMPFGQHKGTPFREIPRDYLEWAKTVAKVDGVKLSIEQELERRDALEASGFGPPRRK